jgi:hypothetical protein
MNQRRLEFGKCISGMSLVCYVNCEGERILDVGRDSKEDRENFPLDSQLADGDGPDGILIPKCGIKGTVKGTEMAEILRTAHGRALHVGQHRMRVNITAKRAWRGVNEYVVDFIKNCTRCMKHARKRKRMVRCQLVRQPDERIIIDCSE